MRFATLALALLPALLAAQTSYTVTTVAGSDPVRDGAGAVNGILSNVSGLALDSQGALYIADSAANRIRKVVPDRSQPFAEIQYAYAPITTIAGVGGPFYLGDDGPASEAYLRAPGPIAIDAQDNLYVADTQNFRIRLIDPQGNIRTIAGTGTFGFGPEDAPALESTLGLLTGLIADKTGNLFFLESGPAGITRLRKMSAEGILTTIAGAGDLGLDADGGPAIAARFLAPSSLAIDTEGNLFIAETARHAVRKIDTTGIITTVAGTGAPGYSGDGGPASLAQLTAPRAIACDPQGNLFIGDSGNRSLRRVSPDGTIRSPVPPLAPIQVLTVDADGYLLLGFTQQINLLRLTDTAFGAPIIGDQDRSGRNGIPATESLFYNPTSVAADNRGRLYIVAESGVRVVREDGIVESFARNAGFRGPTAVTTTPDGSVWVSDAGSTRIVRVLPDGAVVTVASGPDLRALGPLTVDPSGNVYVLSINQIRKVSPSGEITPVAPDTIFPLPNALTTDAAGNLYVADSRLLRKIAPDGTVTTLSPGGNGLTFDPAGNLIFSAGHSVYTLDSNGDRQLIAGVPIPGFSGDGGPALDAQFNLPGALWADSAGAIYVVDRGNHRIRKLQ